VPAIDVAVRAAGIELTWLNVEAVAVNYISMDVEPLFTRSRSPPRPAVRLHLARVVANAQTAGGQDEGDGARRAGEAEQAGRGEHAG
jgi:hypothetical protein